MDGEVWLKRTLGREDTNIMFTPHMADSLGFNDGESVSRQRFTRLASCLLWYETFWMWLFVFVSKNLYCLRLRAVLSIDLGYGLRFVAIVFCIVLLRTGCKCIDIVVQKKTSLLAIIQLGIIIACNVNFNSF